MRTEKPKNKILVLGATGKTGGRVLQRLKQINWPVAVGSRSANPPFDWENTSGWQDVLHDVHSVYISFYPDLTVPGAVEKIKLFAEIAVKNNVKHLVLLSGRGEEEAVRCEEVTKHAGADWTIIRATWFCQNFSEGIFLESLLRGHVALPAGDVGEPFVDADDIADVAVAALTQNGHENKLYEVTGPRLLTFCQAVDEISKATRRPIQYEQLSMASYAEMLTQHGVQPEFISFLTYLFTEVFDGRNARLTDGIEQALGRKPTDFSSFIKKAMAAGVWNV
jgi:uncharacterized protein YbjT (DUF2867 family)